MATALSAISSLDGITLGYRTGTSGAFTTLTGFVFHKDRIPQAQFDDRGEAEALAHTGYLKGPLSPAMVAGYHVQVGGSATDIWVIDSVMVKGQQIALCRRVVTTTLGPDRGSTR
jgi:hypothetical protein